jgi:hypothetical protein
MEDYKEQVSEILSADPQLAKEIQYELKKFDEQEEKRLVNSCCCCCSHRDLIFRS